MQSSLTRLSSRFLPAPCRFVPHPTNRLVLITSAVPKKDFGYYRAPGMKYGIGKSDKSGESTGYNSKHDAIALNKNIVVFGKQGKWKSILWLFRETEKKQLSNTNWATAFSQLGKIKDWDRRHPLFESFANDYYARLEKGGLQWAGSTKVISVICVIGKMRLKNPATEAILAFASRKENARTIVRKGNAQEISSVAWSFATLGVPSPEIFAEIEARAVCLVGHGTPQEIANTAWAFAKSGVAPGRRLFAEIEKRADWLVMNGKPRDVSNLAWAFATLNVRSCRLFAEIEGFADWLVRNGTTQSVSDTAWAFAALDFDSTALFDEIETRTEWMATNGTPREVANTIWAASHLRYYSPCIIKETNSRGAWLVEEGSTRDISNSAIAFANYGYDAAIFFKAVADNISKLINGGNEQQIINVCFAMAILDLGERHSDAYCQLWNTAINLDPARLLNDELLKLGHLVAYCKPDGIKVQEPSALLIQKIGAVVPDSSTRSKHFRFRI